VDRRRPHLDAAEVGAAEIAQELVVVARQVDDAGALAAFAQQLLYDVVVGLRPVPARAQAPSVDDVPDEVDRLGVVYPQELEQRLGLGAPTAEMHVGNEEGPIPARPDLLVRIGVVGSHHARSSIM
jgi:hypothetical protein